MTDIETWDDFINKIKRAKKDKMATGLKIDAVVRLLFVGAFDSLTTERRLAYKSILDMYLAMFAELQSALKSKSVLPKAKGTEIIGLDKVKNEILLSLWRYQINPTTTTPFLDTLASNLGILGFNKDETKGYYTKRTKEYTSIATDEWQRFFTFIDTPFWNSIQKDHYKIFLPGIITKAEVKRIMNNTKELMTVSIYTGRENVSDLVIWPKWGETTVNVHYKESIKVGKVMLLEVKPTYRDGKSGGKINGIQIFSV